MAFSACALEKRGGWRRAEQGGEGLRSKGEKIEERMILPTGGLSRSFHRRGPGLFPWPKERGGEAQVVNSFRSYHGKKKKSLRERSELV